MNSGIPENTPLAEQILLLLLYFNSIWKRVRSQNSSLDDEITEFKIQLSPLFKSISLNEEYFNQFYYDVLSELTTNPKTFYFKLNLPKDWVALWYLTSIVYGIQTYEISNADHPIHGMTHRTQVEASLRTINFAIIYLKIDEKIETRMFKMIMVLGDRHFDRQKILIWKPLPGKYSTDFYMKFKDLKGLSRFNRFKPDYSLTPYNTFQGKFCSNTFLSNNEITKKSKQQFEKNSINKKAVSLLSKRPISLDFSEWRLIEDSFLKDVLKINCLNNFESTLNDMVTKYHSTEDVTQREDLNKKIQKSYYFLQLVKVKDSGLGKIYLSYFYDWRGRFYSYSGLDPLYNKYFRPFYKLNSSLDLNNLRESHYFKLLTELDLNFDNNPILDYFKKIIYLEIGKLYKVHLINKNGVSLADFINFGRKKRVEKLDSSEDELYRFSLNKCLLHIENTGDIPNITIIRDATASSFQHWGIELGIRDDFLEILNISGDRWYDIYSTLIDLFLGENIVYSDKFWIKRRYLKTFIMTIGYNAGEVECNKTLIQRLVDDEYKLSEKDISDIEKFSNLFHKFLKTGLFSRMYLKLPLEVKHLNFFKLDDASINLIYFYTKSYATKRDIKYKGERWIFSKTTLSITTDKRSSDTGRNANLIQARDAHFARYLVCEIGDLFCIHDCFGVSIYKVHNLMDRSNDYFSKYLKYEVYSPFILI